MNDGLLPGNSAPGRFSPDNYYTGYWGPSKQLAGVENPGEQALVTVTFETLAPQVGQSALFEQPTAWHTLCPELPFEAEAFEIHPRLNLSAAGIAFNTYLDVAYGAVGKEVVVLDRFLLGNKVASSSGAGVSDVIGPFPVRLPAGARVAARLTYCLGAGSTGSTPAWPVQSFFYRRYPRPGTRGVTIPLGNPTVGLRLGVSSADADTAWVDVGRVPFDTHWVVPCPMVASLSTMGTGIMTVDYAYVDDTGTEVVIVDNIQMETNTAEWQWVQHRPFPVNLPAGTLIRFRGKFDAATTGTSTFMVGGLTCIGVEDVDPRRRPGQSQIVG